MQARCFLPVVCIRLHSEEAAGDWPYRADPSVYRLAGHEGHRHKPQVLSVLLQIHHDLQVRLIDGFREIVVVGLGRPERLDAGQKRVIADRYGKGAAIPELAEEYGVGVGTIWRALQPETEEAA